MDIQPINDMQPIDEVQLVDEVIPKSIWTFEAITSHFKQVQFMIIVCDYIWQNKINIVKIHNKFTTSFNSCHKVSHHNCKISSF
jgi:hypothetical protein